MVSYDLGVTDHQRPTKWSLGQKITYAEWRNHIIDYRKIIMRCVYSRKNNGYIAKTYKQKFFKNQHAWYFRGDIPLCVWPNKECRLLNAMLVLNTSVFFFWWLIQSIWTKPPNHLVAILPVLYLYNLCTSLLVWKMYRSFPCTAPSPGPAHTCAQTHT